MDNNNEINPLFIYKLLGAKQLKLKFTNLSINTKHKNNAEFNIETIKKISVSKGILFDDLTISLENTNIKFKRLTRNQSSYLQFKIKNLKLINAAIDDISKLLNSDKYINNKLIVSWVIKYKEILKELNIYAAKKKHIKY